jgi:hypothetical protein
MYLYYFGGVIYNENAIDIMEIIKNVMFGIKKFNIINSKFRRHFYTS